MPKMVAVGMNRTHRDRQTVQARHIRINELRARTDLPLKAIARQVGLANHTSVLYHLSGKCTCGVLAFNGCEHEYWTICKHCGSLNGEHP